MKKLIIGLLISNYCCAIDLKDPRQLHDVTHFTTGYALGTLTYGMWKTILGKEDKTTNALLGFATAVVIAGAYELAVSTPNERDFRFSLMGSTAASFTIIAFDF